MHLHGLHIHEANPGYGESLSTFQITTFQQRFTRTCQSFLLNNTQEASAHFTWRREPAFYGTENLLWAPDPALLHLGCYIKKEKKKRKTKNPDLWRSSRQLPSIRNLLVLVLVWFLPSWLHNPALLSHSGIFSNHPDAPSDFSDSGFWHWFQLCWLLRV